MGAHYRGPGGGISPFARVEPSRPFARRKGRSARHGDSVPNELKSRPCPIGADRHEQEAITQGIANTSERSGGCFNFGQTGHRANECLLPVICKKCQQTGHVEKDCPSH